LKTQSGPMAASNCESAVANTSLLTPGGGLGMAAPRYAGRAGAGAGAARAITQEKSGPSQDTP